MKVEFLVDTEPYAKGDVVDFAEDRAEDLIRQGLAKAVDENSEVKIAAEEKAKGKVKTKAVTPEDTENK